MPPQQRQTPEEDRLLRTMQALVLGKDAGIIDREEARTKLNERHDFKLVLQKDLVAAPETVREQQIPIILSEPPDGGLSDLEYAVGFNENHQGDEHR